MANPSPTRDAIANALHQVILAHQDALTHLWAAILAVEVVDVAPITDEKRDSVLGHLKTAYLRWQEQQAKLDQAFHAWSAVVGQEHHELEQARSWLNTVFPASIPDHAVLLADPSAAQTWMDAYDRELCAQTRRAAGLPELSETDPCQCLIECPAIAWCPLCGEHA